MNFDEPQVILIDSTPDVSVTGLEELQKVMEILFVVFIQLKRTAEKKNILPVVTSAEFKYSVTIMKCYQRAIAVKVNGPLQNDGFRCDFFAIAHCKKAMKNSYLSSNFTTSKEVGGEIL